MVSVSILRSIMQMMERPSYLGVSGAMGMSIRIEVKAHLAFAPVIHGTGRNEGLSAPEGIAKHEILKPRIYRGRIGGYLRAIPSYGQRWWAKIGD